MSGSFTSLHVHDAFSTKERRREEHQSNWPGCQDGYGAFTVSRSHVDDVRRSIQNQATHHARTSFQDEFRALLIRHDIEFDERYIWQ